MKKLLIGILALSSMMVLAQDRTETIRDVELKLSKSMYLKSIDDLKLDAYIYDNSRTADMARLAREITRSFAPESRNCINTTNLTNKLGLLKVVELRNEILANCYGIEL